MTREADRVKLDRMRYTNDSLSANLVLAAIALDALYFVSVYQSDVGSYYYTWVIGASVIYNLLFMLTAFLASESVKSRRGGFAPILIGIGVMQFVRMTFIPAQAHAATVEMAGEVLPVMDDGQYFYLLACLGISGICCIAAAITSSYNKKILADYMRSLEQNG